MNNPLPIVGAAMPLNALTNHRDWLLADQRDLELWDFAEGDLLDGDWRGAVAEARSLLDGYVGRLGIHGPWEGLALISSDRRARRLTIDRFKQGLECAAALGASHMVIHSPFDFFGSPHVAHTPGQGVDAELAAVHTVLDEVVPLAAQAGCSLMIEVCYDKATAPLLSLVRSFASPFVQASLDTGHAFVMQQSGGPSPDQWVRDGGPLLGHLHIQDTDGLADRHWAPGEGNLNWYALFEALAEQSHQPRLLIEITRVDKIKSAAAWLAARGLTRG